jgi:hypothetical protein
VNYPKVPHMKGFRSVPPIFSQRLSQVALILVAVIPHLSGRAVAQTASPSAQAALNAINSDLTQEIIAGSTNIGTVANPVYFPSSNINVLPCLVGSTGTEGLENLLKVSVPSPFFSGNTYSGTGTTRACPASTTGTSVNGFYLTPAIWNQALFMPVTGAGNNTPLLVSGTFTPPNWILVARDGSNPTIWNPNMVTSATNTTTVVSRYAYAIYHEGGLLDANVAGYPSSSSTSQFAYKPALAYADLTQIGLTSSQIDTLVGWRNYASTQAPGPSFINPEFNAASAANYYQYVTSNTTGFLTPNSAVYNGQTDQMFTSRQELINFMQSGLGLSGTNLDILNYLATFTRGLSQPSIVPDPTRPLIVSPVFTGSAGGNDAYGLDNQINPAFPTILVSSTFARNDGAVAQIGEPLVNKRFALNKLAWLTYLGPSANRNIPASNPGVTSPDYDMWQLVNTYGFSPAYLAQGTATNIQNYFGLVWQQDTASETPQSFHDGEYKWFYTGHNELGGNPGGTTAPGTATVSNVAGSISRLEDIPVSNTPREPDFFELLKAAVSAGSKAKGAINSTVAKTLLAEEYAGTPGAINEHPYVLQTQSDTDLDYAIIQLGANIIDQFKVDGYCTRIVFNDNNGLVHEFRGVENLPYLYRVQSGTLKLRMENPVLTADVVNEPPGLKDPGIAMIMQVPTIWNPHDKNAPLGDPAPAGPGLAPSISTPNFRLIADSVEPVSIQTNVNLITVTYSTFNACGGDLGGGAGESGQEFSDSSTAANDTEKLYTTGSQGTGTPITPGLSLNPPDATPLDPYNSELTFQVPNSTLFREPTVLAMANLPTGSNLQMEAPTGIAQYNLIQNQNGKPAWSSTVGGFLSDSPNPLDLPTVPASTQTYVGICLALYPVEWAGMPLTGGTAAIHRSDYASLNVYNGGGPFVDYRLQYEDPNPQDPAGSWVTYDEKYTQIATQFLATAFGTTQTGNLSDQADGAVGGDWQSYADPRTSRFTALNGKDDETPVQTPGGSREAGEWADPLNGVGVTDRPDINSGYAISDNRPSGFGGDLPEFYPLQAGGWTIGTSHFRIGLLSQNSSVVQDNGIRFTGDAGSNSTSPEGPMYYSDPDGVLRGAMGNYQTGSSAPATTTVGLPLATAYPAGYSPSSGSPYQGQSRPYILHRPFQTVSELGYVFSGTPWKNIDFFTPQSGDASLLDVFTINETPDETTDPNQLVAGTVNLNTHQEPVLQAVLAGASVDEAQTSGTAYTGFFPLTGVQANSILTNPNGLIARTTSTATGLGPLQNVSELVGRWNSALLFGSNYAAAYTGPSADLENIYPTVFGAGVTGQTMQDVQRFQESFIRPLAAVGNTRVWNLMIDLVAQTGQYPASATTFDNFCVNTQQHYWLHEAIDRYTGQVLDQNLETVGPATLSLSGSTVADNLPLGTTVGSLGSSESLAGALFAYTLVSGTSYPDNASFTISGNVLKTAAVFDYLTKSTYNIMACVTDQNGFTFQQPFVITVQPGPYTQWKIANFGANASNPAVAGDMVDSQNDGTVNLLKYALGKSPSCPATTGITVQRNGGALTMNYTKASAATDVTVTAYWTNNLSNPASWSTSGVTQTMMSDNGTTQQWQATAPENSNKAMFMRLVVTRP